MANNKNPRVFKRDVTGPDDLERRSGMGSTTSRTSGSSRTTRTGTPRTSTNTKPVPKRISPGKRMTTKKMYKETSHRAMWRDALGPDSVPGLSKKSLKKLGQQEGGKASYGITKRGDAKLKKAGFNLSPKQGRKISDMYAKQQKKQSRNVRRGN
jgi:hypothetical protein